MAFVTPVVARWLEQEIAQWVHLWDRSDDPSHHERSLLPRIYISLLVQEVFWGISYSTVTFSPTNISSNIEYRHSLSGPLPYV